MLPSDSTFGRVVDAAAGVRHNTIIIAKDRDDKNDGGGTDNDVDLEEGDGSKQAECTSLLYWWGENVGNEDNLVVVDDKEKDIRNRDESFYDDDDDEEFYRHVSERTGTNHYQLRVFRMSFQGSCWNNKISSNISRLQQKFSLVLSPCLHDNSAMMSR